MQTEETHSVGSLHGSDSFDSDTVCSSRCAICTGRAKSTTTIPFVEVFMVAQQLFAGCALSA